LQQLTPRATRSGLVRYDPEKIHDLLAEPLIVVALHENGFIGIEKLGRFIKSNGKRIPSADLLAKKGGKLLGIEVKTIRMENNPKPVPGKVMGNSHIPYWWGNMFLNNAIIKIEDKKQRVLKQLKNTREHFNCDLTMLVLYNRRLGPSTLMQQDSYLRELRTIKSKYNEIDLFMVRDYFGYVVFYPSLP